MGMYDTRELGYRLLRCRRDLNIDQSELSQRAGVSRPYISQLEHGKKTNVSVDVIEALAEALGVSPSYLLGYTDNPTGEPDAKILAEQSATYIVAEVHNQEERRLTRAILDDLAAMSPEQQRMVLAFLRTMRQIQDGDELNDTRRGTQ